MLIIHVEAETITELKNKVAIQLELALGDQIGNSPVAESPNVVAATIAVAESSPVKRARRTKAEIAAENTPAVVMATITQEITVDECKELLRKIVAKDDAEFTAARKLLQNFGVKKVIELQPAQYVAFAHDANQILSAK